MKNKKKLQFITMILICILIMLAGFLGVFQKKNGVFKNQIPNYTFASDLKGSDVLEFEVNSSTKEVYYDKEGNVVDSATVTDENKSKYTVKKEPINAAENLTAENYKKVSKIMEERLKFLQADQYRLDLDEKNGKVIVTFEDDYSSDIESFLPMVGSLELIDSNTKDVILSSNDFQSVESNYASLDAGYTAYLNFKLNQFGLEKINNLDKYKETKKEETEETTVNQLTIEFDGDQVAEISYDDLLVIGKTLRVTTHKALTANSTIQSALNTNAIVSRLATIGKMPLTYKLTAKEYIKSVEVNYISYVIITIAIIGLIIIVYWIIKYKIDGLLASIGSGTIVALFLIIIRCVAIPISLNGFAGMIALIVLHTIFMNHVLKNMQESNKPFSENIKNAYLQSVDAMAVLLIAFSILSFSKMMNINSAGLLMFWGWLMITLGNLILTIPMLSVIHKK